MSIAVVFVAVMLMLGMLLRQTISPLRRLFIPGSVIAGFLGLGIVSLLPAIRSDAIDDWSEELCSTLSGWPGPLIAVVFATMLLQQTSRRSTKDDSSAKRVARQGLMVWIIVLGETLVGLIATWWLIKPNYDVPNSFGMLIETGFAGGHGTAAAMGQVFSSAQVDLPQGLDLGLLMATCGLVYGLVSGIAWINLASRWNWISKDQTPSESRSDPSEETAPGTNERSPIGFRRMSASVIDPLLLQLVWIALAFGFGMAAQQTVLAIAGYVDVAMGMGATPDQMGADAELSKRLTASNLLDFPLFIYTLLGGWLVRRILEKFAIDDLIDPPTIQRLSSTAMEILVVAAITSLRLSAIATLIIPFSILFLTGAAWTATCLLVISRWILPKQHWFQLGLINYGMSTGTTATGFVLLSVIDPELETDAASDYALAAPLSAPFIGGGILTIGLPLLVLERVSLVWPTVVIGLIILALVLIGYRTNTNSGTKRASHAP